MSDTPMSDNAKPWWQSATIWSGLIVCVLGVLVLWMGLRWSNTELIALGIGTFTGGVGVLVGRARATLPIGAPTPPVAPIATSDTFAGNDGSNRATADPGNGTMSKPLPPWMAIVLGCLLLQALCGCWYKATSRSSSLGIFPGEGSLEAPGLRFQWRSALPDDEPAAKPTTRPGS